MAAEPRAAATLEPAPAAEINPWKSFWDAVKRFEPEKIAPVMALRNTIGVVLPLVIAHLAHSAAAGGIAASGALNVSFSDGRDPYPKRARRMIAASLLCGTAVFVGTLSGRNNAVAVAVATIWAFAAGMLVALGTAAGDLGTMSLVTLSVFAAQPMNASQSAQAGALACAAGLLQTFFAVALWPLRRYEPERAVIASLYHALAEMAASAGDTWAAPPVTKQISEAQDTLSSLTGDHSLEAERYVFLLDQAERVRLCIVTLGRLRRRIARDPQGGEAAELLDQVLACAADVLKSVARSMESGRWEASTVQFNEAARAYTQRRWSTDSAFLNAMLRDARYQVDALAGQLRAIATLANELSAATIERGDEREQRQPWMLRVTSSWAKLRANLSLDSTVFRHALRLAICLGVGDAIARSEGLRRHYWIPMTIAIVLKPDFTATFSRGVLRLAGTFAGLVLATLLFHFLQAGQTIEIVLIAAFTYVLRWLGPANYGILVTAVSALVVLLIASTGISPQEVIAARAVNTLAGGGLALAAYAIWPTWERTKTGEALARLLEAYHEYFTGVIRAYERGETGGDDPALNEARLKARVARTNAEASVDKALSEPGAKAKQLSILKSILASSHSFVLPVMSLEAALLQTPAAPPRKATHEFVEKVGMTLQALAKSLREGKSPPRDLPALREAHNAILETAVEPNERYALVNVETDRITNAVNTLKEQVGRLAGK